MGQLLPVLGNSRCGLKLPDSSLPMPSLWGWERDSIMELPPGKAMGSDPQPRPAWVFKVLRSTSGLRK